jgi:hypothetical protein
MLTALIWPTAEELREQIALTRSLTDKPLCEPDPAARGAGA